MDIGIGSAKEYVLAIIALTGEAERAGLLESGVVSKSRMSTTICRLCESSIRKYKSVFTNKVFLRLSYPEGDKQLRNISEELYLHFGIMVSNAKSRYEVPEGRKARMEYCSVMIRKFIDIGCSIDKIRLTYTSDRERLVPAVRNRQIRASDQDTVFDEDGKLRSMSEIMIDLREDEFAFFTTRALSLEGNDMSNPRSNLTRNYGLFVKNTRAYMCYYVDKPNYVLDISVESDARFDYKSMGRLPRLSNVNGPDGLFFTSDEKVFTDYVARKNVEKRVCDPTMVFAEHTYVLPIAHPMTGQILKLIAEEDCQKRFNRGFFADGAAEDMEYDAFWNGCYWFNFVLGDLNVLRKARTFMKSSFESTYILCQEYQAEGVIEWLKLGTEENRRHVVVIDEKLILRNIGGILNEGGNDENIHDDDRG